MNRHDATIERVAKAIYHTFVESDVHPWAEHGNSFKQDEARRYAHAAVTSGMWRGNVLQNWVSTIPMMQQTVLLTAIRGPDGLPKYAGVKMLLRWYRRCVLLSAMDGQVLTNPYDNRGGSFTGPSYDHHCPTDAWEPFLDQVLDGYMKEVDGIPHHFQMHLMHAVEILGYKHPDGRIANWWRHVYIRLVEALHLHPESETELDARLGDTREGWLARADKATIQ